MKEPSVQDSEPRPRRPVAGESSSAAPMVERAFQLFEVLATSETGYSLSELARRLGMSKGSAHGLLKTLEGARAVEVDGERRYVLGPRMYELAQAYIRRSGLRRVAMPAMRRLAASSSETVFLGQVESDGVRIVERVEESGEQSTLRVSARRGALVHLLAGATGRVVLASWPVERRQEYLSSHSLPHFTQHSITEREAFLAAVEQTARTGLGEDHEEYLAGINAVAAGIRGLGGELIALIWIVGFSTRFAGDQLKRAGEALLNETRAISAAVGA